LEQNTEDEFYFLNLDFTPLLFTAESGKHIILLKFVQCLSKKYTQEY